MGTSRGSSPTNFLVDFENAFELVIESGAIDMRQVEIDHRLSVDAQPVLVDDLVDGSRGHVAGNKITVLGIPLFKEVEALFAAGMLFQLRASPALRGTQTRPPSPRADSDINRQLIFAGNAGGMHLDELAVRIVGALLVECGIR